MVFEKYQDIKDDLLYAIYDSLDPSEFEENWNNVIAKYDLVDNGWLGGKIYICYLYIMKTMSYYLNLELDFIYVIYII